MNYTKNLLELKKKSKFALVLGITSCVLAITMIIIYYLHSHKIEAYMWTFPIFFLQSGIANIIASQGYAPERLIGKAFIEIDEKKISLKTGIFQKLQTVEWKGIDAINYKLNNLVVTKTNKSTVRFALSRLEYSTIQEIKEVVNTIANDKDINIHLN